MNRTICAREDQTSAAVFSGTLNAEITWHAQQCPVCADILLVSEFLHEDTARTAHEQPPLPDPGLIWQKADLRAHQEAVRRALRPIRFMKIIAIVAFVCSPALRWLLPIAGEATASWWKTLDLNLLFVWKFWPVTTSEVTPLVGFSGTIVLLALGSWYMLRQE